LFGDIGLMRGLIHIANPARGLFGTGPGSVVNLKSDFREMNPHNTRPGQDALMVLHCAPVICTEFNKCASVH
jgi:hypothetical protein